MILLFSSLVQIKIFNIALYNLIYINIKYYIIVSSSQNNTIFLVWYKLTQSGFIVDNFKDIPVPLKDGISSSSLINRNFDLFDRCN